MTKGSIKAWALVHKWTSLASTAFLLMLCLTGLPLIFHEEIDRLTEPQPVFGLPGVGSSGTAEGLLPLDAMLARALANRPGEVPLYMAFDNDQPSMTITTGPRPDAPASAMTIQSFDRSTGTLIGAVSEDSVSGVGAVSPADLQGLAELRLLIGCALDPDGEVAIADGADEIAITLLPRLGVQHGDGAGARAKLADQAAQQRARMA
jgi:hypothetical protein